jgi:GTP-binding protein
VFSISALARSGLQPLIERIYEHVSQHQRDKPLPDPRFDTDAAAALGPGGPGAS